MKYTILTIRSFVDGLINKGHARSIKVKQNIAASFLIKGGNVAVNLLLVPLTLHYVDVARYGVWLTLTSIVAWISFFDVGFGNGLRNRFAEAIAKEDHALARIYLSTTYAVLALVALVLMLIFFISYKLINWNAVLNINTDSDSRLSTVVLLVFCFFCLQFVLQLVNIMVIANQQPAKASLINFMGNLLALVVIFVLTKTTTGNLLNLALSLSIAPVIVLALASIWLYSTGYKSYAPHWQYVRFSCAKDLLTLGIRFFSIQVAGLVIFSTDNMIITQLYGPEQVTPYSIAFKYFNTVLVVYFVILSPYWSSITDAYTKGDLEWINKSVKSLLQTSVAFCFVTMMLMLFSNVAYKLWIGDAVRIPMLLSVLMGVYFCLSLLLQPFTTFINGIGSLKLQTAQSVIAAIINIPLAIFFAQHCDLGIAGVILATIVCFLPGLILAPVQYLKIIRGKAAGIWIK